MNIECLFCGLCLDSCPYEIIDEKYSLRGRISLIKEIKSTSYSKDILKYILNCVFCNRCLGNCPIKIDIKAILRNLYEEDEKIKEAITKYVNSYIEYPSNIEKSDILLIINKYYSPLNSKQYKSIINLLDGIGRVTIHEFSDPLHMRYAYNIKLEAFEKMISKLNQISNDIKVIISLDEYTSYFIPLLNNQLKFKMYSITEYLSNLLKDGVIIINRDISSKAILANPIIKHVEDKVIKDIKYVLNFLPSIVISKLTVLPDLPNVLHELSEELALYETILKNMNQDFHILISSSPYLISKIGKVASKLVFIPVYLPSLISQISILL